MARKRNFIGTTETGKLSALGNQKQRDFNYIEELLNDPSISKYFAEPSVREDSQNIDWYTEAEGKVKGFNDFTPNEVSQLKEETPLLTAPVASLVLLYKKNTGTWTFIQVLRQPPSPQAAPLVTTCETTASVG